MSIILSVRLTEFRAASPVDRPQLARLVGAGQASLRRHPGCRRCEIYLDAEDQNALVAVEIWNDIRERRQAAAELSPETVRSALAIMDGEPRVRALTMAIEGDA